jgi:hypothetical protein
MKAGSSVDVDRILTNHVRDYAFGKFAQTFLSHSFTGTSGALRAHSDPCLP